MAIAISYKSESGDDYLSIHDTEDFAEIVELEKVYFGSELPYLSVVEIASTEESTDVEKLESLLREATKREHE